MRDYAKLVEWLRADVLCTYEETKHMQGLAADAIQALCRACANYAEQACENETRWIPVTERLPEENDDVLIYGEWTGASGTKYREIWLTDLKGFLHQGYKPISWMPLPKPPKGETE